MVAAKATGVTPVAADATVTTSTAGGVAMLKSWLDVKQAGGGSERRNRVLEVG
jgi:hypothetical protein